MKREKSIVIILIVLCFTLWSNSALACKLHDYSFAFVSGTEKNYASINNSQHNVNEKAYYMCEICMLTDPWVTSNELQYMQRLSLPTPSGWSHLIILTLSKFDEAFAFRALYS